MSSYNYNKAFLRCEINLKTMYVFEGYFQNIFVYVYIEAQHYRAVSMKFLISLPATNCAIYTFKIKVESLKVRVLVGK